MAPTEADLIVTTARLTLRPVDDAHVPAILEATREPEVVLPSARMPYPYEREHAEALVERSRTFLREGQGLVLAVEDKQSGAFIGVVVLGIGKDDPAVAEVGYWLGKSHWSKGYASEAVAACVRRALSVMGALRVEATVFIGNTASLKVLARVGFRHIGRRIADAPARAEKRREVEVLEITAEDIAALEGAA